MLSFGPDSSIFAWAADFAGNGAIWRGAVCRIIVSVAVRGRDVCGYFFVKFFMRNRILIFVRQHRLDNWERR